MKDLLNLMRQDWAWIFVIGVIFVFAVLAIFAIQWEREQREACEARGGVMLRVHGSEPFVCAAIERR